MNTTRVLEGSHVPAWQPIPDAPRPHTAGAVQAAFPRQSAHRYTQVLPGQKCRHSSRACPGRECRGMQESRAMDGNSTLCKCLIQASHQPADSPPSDWIPAVHAGMTGFNHLNITMSTGAWERSKPDVHGA